MGVKNPIPQTIPFLISRFQEALLRKTVKGYTSKTVGDNVKLLINKDLAKVIGISSQIYIVQYTNAFYDILIPGLNDSSFSEIWNLPCAV